MSLASRAIAGKILRYSLLPRVATVRFASDDDARKSGPYPTTPEERVAAARKYNVRVGDYEPYPDDGFGWGDYPKLPDIHDDYKDPHADWDFPDQRRNYGETPHIDFDYLNRSKAPIYPDESDPVPFWKQCAVLGGVLTTLGILFYYGQHYKLFQPVAPKQYPFNNLCIEKGGGPECLEKSPKHYEF